MLAALACAQRGSIAPTPSTKGLWTLVWSDEFTGRAGAGVDTSRWTYDTGDGCPHNCGWGNGEKEYYSRAPANIALTGHGQLAITARVAPPGLSCYYGPCRYTSAKITTHHKVLVTPGRVEARIRLAAGQGLWPAFWLLGTGVDSVPWPDCGEIDVMENHGSNITTTSSAVHGPGYSGNTPFVHALAPGALDAGFHTYAMEWDSTAIRFFVDDSLHYTVTRAATAQYGTWVYDQPFFLLLNLAVGGHFDGDPQADAIFPARMLVDYVRVYTKTD